MQRGWRSPSDWVAMRLLYSVPPLWVAFASIGDASHAMDGLLDLHAHRCSMLVTASPRVRCAGHELHLFRMASYATAMDVPNLWVQVVTSPPWHAHSSP